MNLNDITIDREGFIYIYVSNQSPQNMEVFFDDLKVVHHYSDIVGGGDYYPFGLEINDRRITREKHRFGYQGLYAEKDEETGWNHFELREYDPVVGRWTSIDPKKIGFSPYIRMGNNPSGSIDSDGGAPFDIIHLINGEEVSRIKTADPYDIVINENRFSNNSAFGNTTTVKVLDKIWYSADQLTRSQYIEQYNRYFGPTKYPGTIEFDAMTQLSLGFAAGDILLGSAKAAATVVSDPIAESIGTGFSLTRHGELTDGVYTVSREAMKKHIFGGVEGRSIFYPTLDANYAVLKAARYADEVGLWVGNKAKVVVKNTNVGTLGSGQPTNVINVYRNSNGFIHGSPGSFR